MKKTAGVPAALIIFKLYGALHLSWSQTTCADMYRLRRSVNDSLDLHYVRLPHSVWASVWVRNLYTKANALSANITFSHLFTPPTYQTKQTSTSILPHIILICKRFVQKKTFFSFYLKTEALLCDFLYISYIILLNFILKSEDICVIIILLIFM